MKVTAIKHTDCVFKKKVKILGFVGFLMEQLIYLAGGCISNRMGGG